ncbi:lytic transglycosylase domain-containing protein [Bombella sp. ESL0378]|uniref:lytic transglycosylase domain-containing protein n=1 Tax=unclassified Bombella TaxID=2644098 RepID=UPI0012D9E26C|nr:MULTISPECIES: lytic transglycosylase domain-containing protein [unclassified Bombella]MCT6856248.1 lytic transglycosylase domain-containing protein [Bombella apis]MUG05163.1 lytic transglycosylase domain-containing protein [Bombella sp. ESL0378]MUG90710.1 lytic transglycosylase domain-containing protein [Bombella sp. ESL0385]
MSVSLSLRYCSMLLLGGSLLSPLIPLRAETASPPLERSQSRLCSDATAQVERALRLPDGFLSAISRVETGRPDNKGALLPWPWSINAAGSGHFYASREEAIAAVKAFQQQGITSIDVGCMQVNLLHHPTAFPSLEIAFDPYNNARYAGMFLQRMRDQTGSWPRAVAAYHSQIASNGTPYLEHVLQQWAIPQGDPAPNISPAPHSMPHTGPKPPIAPRPATAPYRPFIIRQAGDMPVGSGINHAGTGANAFLAQRHAHPPQAMAPQTTEATNPPPANNLNTHRPFRPFRGLFRPTMPPPPHQRLKTSQNGRNLAAYRAMAVHSTAAMPYIPAY